MMYLDSNLYIYTILISYILLKVNKSLRHNIILLVYQFKENGYNEGKI